MKLWKRLSALLVLAALTAALAGPALAATGGAVTAAAAVSSFRDITDPVTGRNADILRLMGVVKGTGGDNFEPNGTLTRAEFCAMLIRVMNKESQVAGQMNRTIFIDVPSTHWARGYVNLAATGDNRLIAGVGNGNFEPDAAIEFGQAVTILIRGLGYKDEEVGSVWPDDHISKAAELGLSKDLTATANQAITRAQAAQLFVNLLSCKTTAGDSFLGATTEAVIFGADGAGNVRTSAGVLRLPGELPASMEMRQGLMVVRGGEIAAFIPGESGVEVTLTDSATEKYLKAGGSTYTVADGAKVYNIPDADGDQGAVKDLAYKDFCRELTAGAQLTAFLSDGKVTALYLRHTASSSAARGDAVVVTGTATAATFYQLTGGAQDPRIVKGGCVITMGDLMPNDVVTYNPVTNTLTASDLRIPTVYDGATPNVRAPEKIRIAGLETELEILPCAADALSKYRLGDSFTVLLTADGKVAGVIPSSSQAGSTAVGVWNGGTVSVPLADDKELTFTASSTIPAGQLVTVSAYSRREASISRITSRTIPGAFDVKAMTLGEYAVAANVRVYERFGTSGPAIAVDLSALTMDVVPADKISVYHLNTSGMVDALVLDNVTGNLYTYGILREGQKSAGSLGGTEAFNRTAYIENSSRPAEGKNSGPITGLAFTDGAFGGVIESEGKVVSLVELTAARGVSADDFFTMNGVQYVSAGGRVYRLADKVECYNAAAKTWFTGKDPVEQAKSAYDSGLTVYVDPGFNMVRVIAAN